METAPIIAETMALPGDNERVILNRTNGYCSLLIVKTFIIGIVAEVFSQPPVDRMCDEAWGTGQYVGLAGLVIGGFGLCATIFCLTWGYALYKDKHPNRNIFAVIASIYTIAYLSGIIMNGVALSRMGKNAPGCTP